MRFKSYAIKFPVNLSKKIKDKGRPINLLLVSVYFLKVKKSFLGDVPEDLLYAL